MRKRPASDRISLRAPPALWRVAAGFMHMLKYVFGAPAEVARFKLGAKAYAFIHGWLRAGEDLIRRLLLIEAAALPYEPARAFSAIAFSGPRRAQDLDQPATWCVRFAVFDSPRRKHEVKSARNVVKLRRARRRPHAYKPYKPPLPRELRIANRFLRVMHMLAAEPYKAPTYSAIALAGRYEALLRAFQTPLRHVRRIARSLNAGRATLARLRRHYPPPQHRVADYELLNHCLPREWPPYNSS